MPETNCYPRPLLMQPPNGAPVLDTALLCQLMICHQAAALLGQLSCRCSSSCILPSARYNIQSSSYSCGLFNHQASNSMCGCCYLLLDPLLLLLLPLLWLLLLRTLTLAGLHQVLHISNGGIGPHLKEVGLPCNTASTAEGRRCVQCCCSAPASQQRSRTATCIDKKQGITMPACALSARF
jgi:hypothetical protein